MGFRKEPLCSLMRGGLDVGVDDDVVDFGIDFGFDDVGSVDVDDVGVDDILVISPWPSLNLNLSFLSLLLSNLVPSSRVPV